jgi:hypothetical protein
MAVLAQQCVRGWTPPLRRTLRDEGDHNHSPPSFAPPGRGQLNAGVRPAASPRPWCDTQIGSLPLPEPR